MPPARLKRLRSTCRLQRRTAGSSSSDSGSLLARWFIPRLDQLNRDLPGCVCGCPPAGASWTRKPGAECHAVVRRAVASGHAGVRAGGRRIGPAPAYHPLCRTAQRTAAALLRSAAALPPAPARWPSWARRRSWTPRSCARASLAPVLPSGGGTGRAGCGYRAAAAVADDLKSGGCSRPGFRRNQRRLALWV